jgi:hypothetical protein
MLHILSNVASAVGSLPSPASSTQANAATSPTLSDMDVSSIASTPPSRLFHLQAQEEAEEPAFLLPPIDDLFDQNKTDAYKSRCKPLPYIEDLQILNVTTAQDGWGKIDDKWGPLPQPNGWDHPSAKPYSVDDFPILSPPPSNYSDADGEYEDEEEEFSKVGVKITNDDNDWPSPPPSPKEGNDMRPPCKSLSGEEPGYDWRYNKFGEFNYYRFLIQDPNLPHRQVVAPYIRYNMDPANPQISGTFGRNYPITTRSLRPSPVDYRTPTLTALQLHILRTGEPFTPIIDYIIDEHCPLDLKAGIINYRYHDNARHAIEATIKSLHERAQHHLEKSIQALDFLENANILGRLIAHTEEFDDNPTAYAAFFHAVTPFKGHVTYSGSNTQIDPSLTNHLTLGPPSSAVTVRKRMMYSKPFADTAKTSSKGSSGPSRTERNKPSGKRCHKCRKIGHIRKNCPMKPQKVKRFHH